MNAHVCKHTQYDKSTGKRAERDNNVKLFIVGAAISQKGEI